MTGRWTGLVLLCLSASALAQGLDKGPLFIFRPAWGYRAYVNEEFALKPTDHGQCEVEPDAGLVVCGVKTGKVLAFAKDAGELVWSFKTRGSVRTRPAFDNGQLFVGSSDGCLYRLDAQSGRPTWPRPYCTDAAIYGGPVVSGDTVLFSVTIDKIYAVSGNDGRFLWEYHRDRPRFMSAEGVASPAVEDDRVYVGFSDGALVALVQGKPVWTADLGVDVQQKDVDATPVLDGEVLYTAAFGQGPAAVRKSDGHVLWRGRFFGCTRPQVYGDRLVFGTADGEVVAAKKDDGAVLWVMKMDEGAAYQPVVVADVVIAGGDRGLYSMDWRSGFPLELLAIPYGVRSTLTLDGRRLFFVGGGGTVNAVDIEAR